MRARVRIYVRLRIWRRGDFRSVVQVRHHLGFVMVSRADYGLGQILLWDAFSEVDE